MTGPDSTDIVRRQDTAYLGLKDVSVEYVLSEAELNRRLKTVKQQMSERSLECLLLPSTPGQPSDGAYVSGHYPWARQAWVVVRIDAAEPALLTTMQSEAHWADELAWDLRVEYSAQEELESHLFDLLGSPNTRVGISRVQSLVPPRLLEQLSNRCSSPPLDVTDMMERIRSIKSPAEVIQLDSAAALARSTLEQLVSVQSGSGRTLRESELFAEAERLVKASGALRTHFLTSDGGFLRPPRFERSTSPAGQLLSLEFADRAGYWVEVGTTVAVDPRAPAMQALAVVQEALEDIRALLRPGQSSKAAAQSFAESVKGTRWSQGIWLGHGIGIDISEPPFITSTADHELREGMVIAVHPHVVDPSGETGAYLSRTLVVENERTRVLGYDDDL